MYVILIFFYAVTIVGLYQICCLLFGKNAFTAVQGMILSTYLPYAFLVNNIYGDHIGYAFAVVAVWMAFLYRQSGKMRYSLFCGINMALAVIFKQKLSHCFCGNRGFLFHAPYYRSYSGKTGETENDRKSDSGYSADFYNKQYPYSLYQFPFTGRTWCR